MNNQVFIGRKKEQKKLKRLLNKKSASIVAITGRRRVGKSRLITHWAKDMRLLRFAGIPPQPKITEQDQRNIFSQQLGAQLNLPGLESSDWANLFLLLARQTNTGRVTILLDEISWMGSKDPTFLGKLKNAWDMEFSKNPELILILCGSVSTWVEKNIISSTGYFGRITQKIELEELPLVDSNHMLEALGFKHSSHEKFKVLSITGGIPWYLEHIQGLLSADENIRQLCFEKNGLLVNEFELLFHDLFESRNAIYKRIVQVLTDGPLELSDIAAKINYSKSGALSEYLEDLVQSGFIARDYAWSLKTKQKTRLNRYRLRDNYLRFYLKYIEKNLNRIERDAFSEISLSDWPGWETCLGLQFENLVLNNRQLIIDALEIEPSSIVYDNPFFQHKTTRQKGVQVDYLIQTRFNTLYLCEIKFSRNAIKSRAINEVKEKIKSISIPRNFSVIPILIHVNGVDPSVEEADFFARIIDFSEFLRGAEDG